MGILSLRRAHCLPKLGWYFVTKKGFAYIQKFGYCIIKGAFYTLNIVVCLLVYLCVPQVERNAKWVPSIIREDCCCAVVVWKCAYLLSNVATTHSGHALGILHSTRSLCDLLICAEKWRKNELLRELCWEMTVFRCWKMTVFRCWKMTVFRCWKMTGVPISDHHEIGVLLWCWPRN